MVHLSFCISLFFCACLPFYLLYRFSTLRQDADLSKVQTCRILRSIFLAFCPFFWYYCKYDKKAKETETKQMRDIPKFDSREIGQNLRSLMKQHDMTVKDLQKILGLSCPQTIYHWLNGDSVPTIDNLYNLSHHFDICINELLMGHCPKV